MQNDCALESIEHVRWMQLAYRLLGVGSPDLHQTQGIRLEENLHPLQPAAWLTDYIAPIRLLIDSRLKNLKSNRKLRYFKHMLKAPVK